MNEIVNNNLTLSHTAISAVVTITNIPSIKNNASNSPIWFDKISISLSAVQTPIITDSNGAGIGDILPTSIKVNENGKTVLRVGDNVVISCAGTAGGNPVTDDVTVTIQNAGQTKVVAL